MKPKIAITCNYDQNPPLMEEELMLSGQDWNFLAGDYIYAVERAGGIPILLPVYHQFDTLRELLDLVDGVVLSGGHNINPTLYGQRPSSHCGSISSLRDNRELALTQYLLQEKKMPVLGICRGAHLMNIALGGTLYQHLPSEAQFEPHCCTQLPRNLPSHKLSILPHCKLAHIFDELDIKVNSFHHQGLHKAGTDVALTAFSTDQVPEALEVAGHPFAIGVQWHPETMYDSPQQMKLWNAFMQACVSERDQNPKL